jgi:hypothetical protein
MIVTTMIEKYDVSEKLFPKKSTVGGLVLTQTCSCGHFNSLPQFKNLFLDLENITVHTLNDNTKKMGTHFAAVQDN